MKILYVAKHGKGCNDNEGAITYALREMGHEVFREYERIYNPKEDSRLDSYDLCLFQNWKNPPQLDSIPCPKVLWYFDGIYTRGGTIPGSWSQTRKAWMKRIIPQVDMAFCTDGDYVIAEGTNKTKHLMQGADERFARFTPFPDQSKILFTGSVYGKRKSFIREMQRRYQDRFLWKQNCYKKSLFNKVSQSAIVVCPDSPVSDRYYSNRVYIMCSLGGFVIHPYSEYLTTQYIPDEEIVLYKSKEEMHDKIEYYLSNPKERMEIARAGYQRTIRDHFYRHRLQTIMDLLKVQGVI